MKRRADGRWRKSFTDEKTGKKVYIYSSENTESRALRDIERQMREYKEKGERGITFDELCDEWETEHYPTISPTTAYRYAIFVRQIKATLTTAYVKEITLLTLTKILQQMSMKGYSSKTLRDCTSVIRLLFKFAVIKGYIDYDKNPSAYLTPPKGKPSVTREALTKEEIAAVNEYKDDEIGKLMFFCLYSGLRRGEVLALEWSDIDMENKIIYVNKSVYHTDNNPKLKGTKTSAGTRKVILLDILYNEIKKWRKTSKYVFDYNGGYYTRSALQHRTLAYTMLDSRLQNVTLHRLRHSFCTMLYEFDVPVKDAQILMGHADIATTQNIYTHIRENRMLETANKINSQMNIRGQ